MRRRKLFSLKIVLFICLLVHFNNSLAASRLLSVKKGEEGIKSWAVLVFDEKVHWIGVTRVNAQKLSLYIGGSAGTNNGKMITLNSGLKGIFFQQVNQDPPVFRADIEYDERIPIAIIKKNRHLVITFNVEKLFNGTMTAPEDISATPGRLVNISSSMENNQFISSFDFDGSFEWVGFLRPNPTTSYLLFHGADLFTADDAYAYENAPLESIRLFGETDANKGFKVELEFLESVNYSVIRKSRNMILQTRKETEQLAMASEVKTPADADILDLTTTGISDSSGKEEIPLETLFEEIKDSQPDEKNQSGVNLALGLPVTPPVSTPAIKTETLKTRQPTGQAPKEKIPETVNEETQIEEKDDIPWDDIVSTRFRSTPIKDALRTLARTNSLNMVIAEEVDGLVTMDLQGVTLRQAMNKIVHTYNCEYYVDNDIITVKPVALIYKGGAITKVYRLKYADAENVAKVIKQVASSDSLVQVFSQEYLNNKTGENRVDKRPNAVQGIHRTSVLVVTDRPEKIKEIDRVIRDLDKPPVQFVIQSKLVETSPLESNEVGINWDKTLSTALWQQQTLSGGDINDYSFLNDDPGEGGEWRMGSLSAAKYQMVLDFLQDKTDTKLKSNPRILAMDNEESSISVGTTVPIPKLQRGMGGQGDMITFDYKEVNIQLNVTPHLGHDGDIIMYVNPVIEEITDWVVYGEQRAPITAKRAVNSIVSVRNGETIVIGGLIKSQRTKRIQKVWLLGSIPLIGKLFQHEKFEDKQTDLMIFITPTIVQS